MYLDTEEKVVASLVSGIFPDSVEFDFRGPIRRDSDSRVAVVIDGKGVWADAWTRMCALVCHFPNYEPEKSRRTRITRTGIGREDVDDFVYEHKELFDNCFWRIVDLSERQVRVETFRPQYEGRRGDFVDVEFEFVLGRFSNPVFQRKLRSREQNPALQLSVLFCGPDSAANLSMARHTLDRHPVGAPPLQLLCLAPSVSAADVPPGVLTFGDTEGADARFDRLLAMARYLNYFYSASYSLSHIPAELPKAAVDEAWKEVKGRQMVLSNVFNIMTMASKMRTLGHSRDDWRGFYALTAAEIEEMTPVEHNRWSVERLLSGSRPCTDAERKEVLADLSLKKKYKNERNAHSDLVAFDELGVDATGLNVARYDSDLIAAIPLIVKSFADDNL